ncbi:unnamed protein product, partial [Ectocarpus sp. 4 AP-2014]
MGYGGAFLGAQLDLTTVAGEEYITFTVSYVKKGSSSISRVALATRAFPGSHTADDIQAWIEAVRLLPAFIFYFLFFGSLLRLSCSSMSHYCRCFCLFGIQVNKHLFMVYCFLALVFRLRIAMK